MTLSSTLSGIRVLDFTLAAVGPFCTRVLADLGAEVIHVEYPRVKWAALNDGRQPTRFPAQGMKFERHVQLFAHANAGKKSLAVNLKTAAGIDLIRSLIEGADVIVQNMTPRVMTSFGLDYESIRAINPRIIMCSMSGFGLAGLDGDTGRPCTDPVAQAMSGFSWVTGERDGPPYAIGGGIGDTATSITGVAAILAALIGRQSTGAGQHIDLSMVESLAYLDCTVLPGVAMSDGAFAGFRNGQQNSYTFPMGPFKTGDGYIALQASGVGPDSPWGRLCRLMGREDLVADERLVDDYARLEHSDEVIAAIEDWLSGFDDREGLLLLLASERISSGPVLSQTDMLTHPFFEERGTFGDVEYPGLGPVRMVQPPFKFSDAAAHVRGPAPEMGEHTRAIARQELGLSDAQIDQLIEANVLYESEGAAWRNASAGCEHG